MSRTRLLEVGATFALLVALAAVGVGAYQYWRLNQEFDAALLKGDLRSLNRLLARGAVLSERRKLYAMGNGAFIGDLPLLSWLLQHGADVNAHDPENEGRTALMSAHRGYQPQVVAFLLSHGA